MRIAAVLFVISAIALVGVVGVATLVDADEAAIDRSAPTEVSVEALVEATPKWVRRPIEVTGRAYPVDREYFVLRGRERSMVVQPEPQSVAGTIERGEQVTVTGRVTGYDRLQVAELDRLLESGRHPALADAPVELEDSFITADAVDATS